MPIGTLSQDAEGIVQWKIEGFTSPEMDASLKILAGSPDFSCAGGEWHLLIHRVCPAGGRSGQRIELQLGRLFRGAPRTLDVEYTFSVQSRDGHRHGERRNRKEFRRGDLSPWIGFELEEERMSDLVPNDTLTVLCQLEHIDPALGPTEASTSRSTLSKMRILRDFKEMLVKQEDCDVVIRVKKQEFRAHSIILKARSPVLASMLCSNMREKATGIIEIDDVDPSVFSNFLRFLYCAEVDSLSIENVFGLYTASDKYDLPELRSECAEFMNRTLSNDTFCDVFRLAVLHSDTLLTDACTDYFLQNASSIVETDAWKAFTNENPKKSIELFTKFVTGKEDKSFKRIKLSDE